MDMESSNAWKAIVQLSDVMLGLAKNEEWENLVRLERKRDRLIKEFFATDPQPEDNDFLTRGIKEILHKDSTILEICRFRKNNTSDRLNRFSTSRRAKNAYLRNSA